MNKAISCCVAVLSLLFAGAAFGQSSAPSGQSLPYSPSLDVTSMDRSIDPCVDLYRFSCGGWQKKNPIPADQTSWSVYAKLHQDNLDFLRSMLEQAAKPSPASAPPWNKRTGDFYAACMNEAAVEKSGLRTIQSKLDAIAQVKSLKDLTPVVAQLQFTFRQYSYTSVPWCLQRGRPRIRTTPSWSSPT